MKHIISRFGLVVVGLMLLGLPAGCVTTSRTSIEIRDERLMPLSRDVPDDAGEIVSEESTEYEMVAPGEMIVEP
ncbi:MAG: hypothetical protein ACE5E6_09665 [Phycisphaerae bacterium]